MTYSFSIGNNKPNLRLADPNWWAIALEPRDQIPGGGKLLSTGFTSSDAIEVTAAAAAIAATTVGITAVTGTMLGNRSTLIPSGVTISFGSTKFATLTASFMDGDTALTVAALPVAIAANDKASYSAGGLINVPSGTFIGRTQSDIDDSLPFRLATAANIASLVECYLTAFENTDLTANSDVTLTRPGFVVKENRLPNWVALDAAIKSRIRLVYTCTVGV